jgi:hypothetical protein
LRCTKLWFGGLQKLPNQIRGRQGAGMTDVTRVGKFSAASVQFTEEVRWQSKLR